MRAFLEEHRGRAVLLMTDGAGVRGVVHDVEGDVVTLWNPKLPFRRVPLDDIVGYTGQHRLDYTWGPDYRRCVGSQTCALHYPAA